MNQRGTQGETSCGNESSLILRESHRVPFSFLSEQCTKSLDLATHSYYPQINRASEKSRIIDGRTENRVPAVL